MTLLHRLLAGLALCASLFLVGCANTSPMAFADPKDRVTEDSKPIYLMTVTLKNTYHSWFQPRLRNLRVAQPGKAGAPDIRVFFLDPKAKAETDDEQQGNSYYLRMELAPGSYELESLTSSASSFPVVGWFSAPLHAPVESAAPGVYYLGHVEAEVRERQSGEFRAGPLIPLLDQAAAGASGGTFEVAFSDRFEADVAVFRERFAALDGIEIKKAVLPPFDRAKAQKHWEDN